MVVRYALIALSTMFAFAIVAASALNGQVVKLSLLNWQGEMMLMVLIAASIGAGALFGSSIAQLKVGKVSAEKKKLEWDAQDAKLMVSVQTDREKQLEAKITTLEAALKAALKK